MIVNSLHLHEGRKLYDQWWFWIGLFVVFILFVWLRMYSYGLNKSLSSTDSDVVTESSVSDDMSVSDVVSESSVIESEKFKYLTSTDDKGIEWNRQDSDFYVFAVEVDDYDGDILQAGTYNISFDSYTPCKAVMYDVF